jgi:hypothetical protein
VSHRQILGIVALACVACCIGPVIGALSAIAALGVIGAAFIGGVGFAITFSAVLAIVLVRRRRRRGCAAPDTTRPVRFNTRA